MAASLLTLTLPLLLLLVVATWSGPVVVSGFGHMVFTSFERKVTLFTLCFFTLYLLLLLPSYFFSNAKSYDFILTLYHLTAWLVLLFYVSNVLSLSFVIEVLTGLVTLMLVTSHSPSYYNAMGSFDYTKTSFLTSMSTTYLYSLLMFFWTSLITTLMLFLFLLVTYTKFLTVDWALLGVLSDYLTAVATSHEVSSVSFSWLVGLFCIMLKCAITPFFLWKPTFFKGITLPALFYYIFIFYLTLFLYFINFLMGLFSELAFLNLSMLAVTLFLSVGILPGVLYETLNLKAFLAMSSIMNSVIAMFVLLNFNFVSTVLFL